MSSHHIVREKQEPALLILALDDFDEEYLGQLLEWSPTIVANEESAEKLYSLAIKFDVLLTENAVLDLQENLKVILVANDALKTGLQFLVDEKYPAVNIITNKNSIDQFLPFAAHITLVIYCQNQKIYPVHTGFEKWKPADEVIAIFCPPTDLAVRGLEKISQNQYKTVNDGFFKLDFEQPFLFIAEEI